MTTIEIIIKFLTTWKKNNLHSNQSFKYHKVAYLSCASPFFLRWQKSDLQQGWKSPKETIPPWRRRHLQDWPNLTSVRFDALVLWRGDPRTLDLIYSLKTSSLSSGRLNGEEPEIIDRHSFSLPSIYGTRHRFCQFSYLVAEDRWLPRALESSVET